MPLADYHRGMTQNDNKCSAIPLVEITRGSLVESIHRGFIIAVDPQGAIHASIGETETRTWYRSAAKPFQTIPLLASGAADHFQLSQREIAVINGSHSGEPIHLEVVGSILQKTGLSANDLLCGSHSPFDNESAKKLRAEGQSPHSLHNNCSGKHSGMLAFAKFIGEPTGNYIDPQHPIQRRILNVISLFTDVSVDEIAVAVDGCSAPVFGVSIKAMALSYARLVGVRHTKIGPELANAAERVVSSMIEFPEMVGGSRSRLDTDLMKATAGKVISKVGAEGVQLLGVLPCERYPVGLGIAIKIEDGDIKRARDPVVIETLRQLGVLNSAQTAELSRYAGAKIFNHRHLSVGEIRPCFKL